MTPTRTLNVALIGCGQIADAHLSELRKIAGIELVGACDVHRDLAEQAAARFGVKAVFDSVSDMLARARPDVVHVTTPPHTHKALALTALEAGAHVYVEKPFAVDAAEASEMLEAAELYGRKICVGHDQLFDPVWLEYKRRYATGEFGDVVHIDAVQGYDLSGPFGALLSEDPEHWVHGLPGGLFQNTISHAVSRIADLMPDERPGVRGHWFSATPSEAFPTDLRVMVHGAQTTAHLLFSSRARPVQRVARMYGTRAVVEMNLDAMTLRVERPSAARGPFIKLQLSWSQLSEARRAWTANLRRFLHSELQFFGGMRRLIDAFYTSIREESPSPTPPSEIMRITAIMDDIFRSCAEAAADDRRARLTGHNARQFAGGAV